MKNYALLFCLIISLAMFSSCGEEDPAGCETKTTFYQDLDEDGLGDPATGVEECEAPDGYVDNSLDDDDTEACTDPTSWYEDSDEDGLGNPASMVQACSQPVGYVSNDDDTDDTVVTFLTPEQHKDLIEAQGVALVREMSTMEQASGMQALIAFGKFLDSTGDQDGEPQPVAGRITSQIVGLVRGEITASAYARAQNEDPQSISEFWEQNKGVYDWNATTEDWDVTEGGDVIQFNFPSEENGTSNNASLTFRDYQGTTIANPIDEDYSGDLPTDLLVDLIIDDVKEVEYSLEVDYNSDGLPESITTYIFINPYKLTVTLTNTTSKVGYGFSLENAVMELIGYDIEINGDFSEGALKDEDNDEDPSDVITDGSVQYRVMDFRLSGSIDFAGFYADVSAIVDEDREPTEADAAAIETALNEHVSIKADYISSEVVIAEAEFYVYLEEDEFFPEEKYIELGVVLRFEDDSAIDIEDYLGEGWEQLESELEDLFVQVEDDIDS